MSATYSIETEQALLGAVLMDARCLDRLGVQLGAEHFYREDHRRIFGLVRDMLAEGRTPDLLSVLDAADRAGVTQAIGGMGYLAELAGAVLSTATAPRYAEILVERATLRGLQSVAGEIMDACATPGKSAKEKVDFAQGRIMALSDKATLGAREPQRVSDLMRDYLADLTARWETKGGGLSTGFPDLDRRINGGMVEGQLIILAGRPGMGKTTLALQVAQHVAEHGTPVLVCSQEMPTGQLIDRAIASLGRIDLELVTQGGLSEDEHDRMTAAAARLRDMPLYLDEQGALKIEDVRRKARQVLNRGGLGLLVIDYLQLMVGSGGDESRNQEITKISGALKALAKELRIPVIALSQLSRKCEERPNKRPVMSDLRESGAIEQDADMILAAYRDEVYCDQSIYKGLAELLMLKVRQGQAGGFVPLAFHGQCTRFDSMFGDWPTPAEDKPARKKRGFGNG